MRKVPCTDCGRKREAERPVVRLVDGTILFVCRQCWKALYWYVQDNGEDPPIVHWFLWVPMLESDREVLRRLR